MQADAEQVEATLQRYARPRVAEQDTEWTALAADGKHIRGANRNGSMHFETVTLVKHSTGVPVASLNYHDDGAEIAAVGALLEEVPIAGTVITIDALHTTLDTAASIVEKHAADYLMAVKQNAPETYEALVTMPWNWPPDASVRTRRPATVASTSATRLSVNERLLAVGDIPQLRTHACRGARPAADAGGHSDRTRVDVGRDGP